MDIVIIADFCGRFKLEVRPNLSNLATKPAVIVKLQGIEKGREKSCFPSTFNS